MAGAALAVALTFALLAPGLAAIRADRDARARLASLATQRRAAALVEGELRRVTGALVGLATFDATRRSHTALLADLTDALPEGTALVAFRTDTALGSLVALTPRAAIVLGAMEKVRGTASPEVFGPVTKEVVNGKEYERVTVRFRLLAAHDVAPAARADTTAMKASTAAEERT
jgi:hypothetical protein